jgi:hypothetical protein
MTSVFRLIAADGDDLGDYKTAVPGPWAPGDLLYAEGHAKYRIRAVITADDFDSDVYAGFWEVEPVARQPH